MCYQPHLCIQFWDKTELIFRHLEHYFMRLGNYHNARLSNVKASFETSDGRTDGRTDGRMGNKRKRNCSWSSQCKGWINLDPTLKYITLCVTNVTWALCDVTYIFSSEVTVPWKQFKIYETKFKGWISWSTARGLLRFIFLITILSS
jgi:hypothetical protein